MCVVCAHLLLVSTGPNILRRHNPQRVRDAWQLFFVWFGQTTIGHYLITYEGFADFIGSEGGGRTGNQLIVPRLLVDIGPALGIQQNKLHAGIEWQYWNNQFGVNGVTESVPQAQLKWVFQ